MFLSLEMTSMSLTLFQLTDMNTIILDQACCVTLAAEKDVLPDVLNESQQEDFHHMYRTAKQASEPCCLYTNSWGLTYLSRRLESEEAAMIIIGPFLMQAPDSYSNIHVEQRKHMELEEFYRGLRLVSSTKVQSMANLLEQAGSLRQAAVRMVEPPTRPVERTSRSRKEHLLNQPDDPCVHLIDKRYQVEKEMRSAVEHGDKELLRRLRATTKNLFDMQERFPNQPLRAMKNALVILNTLFRIAAENGKVQPFFLHQISERFAKKIERCETINALNSLSVLMSDDYCDLVRDRARYGYSTVVQSAAEYLSIHFSKPMNLKNLSHHCRVHPAHLSRQFKKETRMTLTEFQQRQRIREAKVLLKTDRATIGWIAGYVGFDDAGFFTRVFKKLEGMTPSEYRNS
ncbi:helix-turn-helix domain-containing protein [Paenibacillus puerhi]|uniref:helix-turn-helix domain-containing protein n=1 Tax=Paenibacillus puerhi TaxID=2692622 RepID=UPI0013572DD4|nr:helix-turn-helix domain-containing protein [Paenibacillus puerhi]